MSALARAFHVLLVGGLLLSAGAPPAAAAEGEADRGEAYYHFSLAHLYRQLAMQFVRQEYVDKAIEEYQKAIEADPESVYLRRELIKLYASGIDLDKAVAEANQLIARDPKNAEHRKLLGQIYEAYAREPQSGFNENMVRRAITQYEEALELEPDDFESLLEVSGLYRMLGQGAKAEEALSQALESQPQSQDALFSLGSLRLEQGDAEGAIKLLEQARGDEPDSRLLQSLAIAYEQAGRSREAADIYQQILDLRPRRNVLPLRESLARNLLLSGQYEDAAEQYELLAEAQPRNPEIWLRLSQIRREQARFDEAWDHLRQAQELAPGELELNYNVVMLLEAERRFDEAIEGMQEILVETEKNQYEEPERAQRAMFLEQLASLYRGKEDFAAALETYDRIAKLAPSTKSRTAALKVDTLRVARRFDEALETASRAVDEFPDDRPLKTQRATLLAETGDVDEAANIVKELIDEEGEDLDLYLTLAQIYEKGKQYEQAIAAADDGIRIAEGRRAQLAAKFTKGSVLERAKQFDKAEQVFRELLEEDPQNASALNYLGYMLADQGVKLDEAHDMVQRALDLEPNNGAYLDSLGWVYYRQEKFELAKRYLLRSLEQYGRDPVVHSHLGDVYYKLGQPNDARRHWERGLAEFHRSPAAERDPVEMARLKDKLAELGVQEVSQAEQEEEEAAAAKQQ